MEKCITSFSQDSQLLLQFLPSSDIAFATINEKGQGDMALVRSGIASTHSRYNHLDVQSNLGAMIKTSSAYPLMQGIGPADIPDDEMVDVVTIPTDIPDVYMAMVKTENHEIGLQTFHANWRDTRDNVPPVWLGRRDVSEPASLLLATLYENCSDNFPVQHMTLRKAKTPAIE